MIHRLPLVLLAMAAACMSAQDEMPGVYGKITARPKAGELAPEVSFSKVLHNPGSAAWTTANLSGQLTVLYPFPHLSGNPELVDRWNALIERFAGKPVQFVLVTGEKDATLLPFLKAHPIGGWVLHDPEGATGRAYGLEMPAAIMIGADRLILGFQHGIRPEAEVVSAVLADRERGSALLSKEARRMPRPQDHRPDFAPSYEVHIAPARSENGGNFVGMDYWSLQGFTVKRLLAEVLGVNAIRIQLPASVDTAARYDVAVVLPRPQEREEKQGLIRQGVEDYFHLTATQENLLRDVYVLTAPDRKPPAAPTDPFAGGDGFTSFAAMGATVSGDSQLHDIHAVTDIGLGNASVEEFCQMLERGLDRPVVNETNLDGNFNFDVKAPSLALRQMPPGDFVQRLREQLGLVIAPGQRSVETTVYRLR